MTTSLPRTRSLLLLLAVLMMGLLATSTVRANAASRSPATLAARNAVFTGVDPDNQLWDRCGPDKPFTWTVAPLKKGSPRTDYDAMVRGIHAALDTVSRVTNGKYQFVYVPTSAATPAKGHELVTTPTVDIVYVLVPKGFVSPSGTAINKEEGGDRWAVHAWVNVDRKTLNFANDPSGEPTVLMTHRTQYLNQDVFSTLTAKQRARMYLWSAARLTGVGIDAWSGTNLTVEQKAAIARFADLSCAYTPVPPTASANPGT